MQPTHTVLIVEPDAAERSAMCRMVRGLGYEVSAAPGGREALELVWERPGRISVVLAALLAPQMDGSELAERLRGTGVRVALVVDADPAPAARELLAAYPELPVLHRPLTLGQLYETLATRMGTAPADSADGAKVRASRRSSERRAIP